jgi:predicted negative regulator of RcsB-dependent stress response
MNTQEKFDLYIEGLLSKKEMQELEDQFKSKPELYDDFKEFSKVNQLLKSSLSSPLLDCKDDLIIGQLSLQQRLMIEEDVSEYLSDSKLPFQKNERDFKELLNSIKNKSKESRKKKFLTLNPFIKIAAAIIIIFSTSILVVKNFNFSRKQLSAILIFKKFYDPVNDKSLKPYGTYYVIMQKAMVDFRNADFDAANSSLEMISKDYDSDYMYNIMKGLILLEEGKSKSAKEYFKTAINEAGNDSRFVAKWYLGLTLLKENNTLDALPLFTDLSQVQNPYKKDAKKILKTVKRE